MHNIQYISPLGTLELKFNEDRLQTIEMPLTPSNHDNVTWKSESSHPVVRYLNAFFKGKQAQPELKWFDWSGVTSFQSRVLQSLLTIPCGEVRTYSEVAASLGSPLLRRAVGGALRRNPFPLIFPCHRVVGKQNLGGYSGKSAAGRKWKESLLAYEKQRVVRMNHE